MDGDLTEAEREQIKAMASMQKVAMIIVRKWLWLIIAVFAVLSGAFSVYLVWRAAYSVNRFNATTRLLYTPRTIAKIEGPSDRQVMSILDRRTLKRRVGTRMPMAENERMCLVKDLEIRQERKPSNLFTVTAASGSWKGAVQKVNLYAEILIQEYVNYRTRDLDNLTQSLHGREKDLVEKLAQVDGEVRSFVSQTGESAPVEALQVLNGVITEQRREVSSLNVQIANEDMRRRKFERETGGNGAAVASIAPQIRQRSEAISQIDAELAKLREVYTDINPKVMGKMGEREALRKELEHFLSDKGVADVNVDNIDSIEKAAAELADVATKLAVLNERLASVKGELAENEKKVETLNGIVPRYERLRVRRSEFEAGLREVEDKIGDIAYLKESIRNDLQQIERAGGAGDRGPMGAKQFIMALVGAGFVAGALLAWLLAYELVWGKVRGGSEVLAYDSLSLLGSLPAAGCKDDGYAADAIGVVAMRLCSADALHGVALVCRLPGSETPTAFHERVAWSASMSGLRVFRLSVVPSSGFEPPEGSSPMIGLHRKDARGWFPVSNRFALAPTERQMLAVDLESLRKEFDMIFVVPEGDVRKGGSFLAQLLSLTDSAIVVLGANKTPRSWFSYMRQVLKKADRAGLVLVTDASDKEVRKELEAGR